MRFYKLPGTYSGWIEAGQAGELRDLSVLVLGAFRHSRSNYSEGESEVLWLWIWTGSCFGGEVPVRTLTSIFPPAGRSNHSLGSE